jgi:hypothetical protein
MHINRKETTARQNTDSVPLRRRACICLFALDRRSAISEGRGREEAWDPLSSWLALPSSVPGWVLPVRADTSEASEKGTGTSGGQWDGGVDEQSSSVRGRSTEAGRRARPRWRPAHWPRGTARAEPPVVRARCAGCGGRGLCRGERGSTRGQARCPQTGVACARTGGDAHARGIECDGSTASVVRCEVSEVRETRSEQVAARAG